MKTETMVGLKLFMERFTISQSTLRTRPLPGLPIGRYSND